jgi:ribosome modulation factor
MQVRINWKRCVWIGTIALAFGVTGGAARIAASPAPQDQHDQDYSKNKNYQTGMRDGRDDNAHNRDHFRKRKFKKDDDKNAYESGYQAGHQGSSSDHR